MDEDEDNGSCILIGGCSDESHLTWCGQAPKKGLVYESAEDAALVARAGATASRICRVCAVALARTLLQQTRHGKDGGDEAGIAGTHGGERAIAELPRLVYETTVLEVGAYGEQGSLLRLLRAYGRSTTIAVAKKTAQAFAAHLYERVRVTVEVLPPAPEPEAP